MVLNSEIIKGYKSEFNIHEKINIKSWYGNYYKIFVINGLLCYKNTFCSAPAILSFCGIAQYDCPYFTYKKGDRLDGVTDSSIHSI